MSPSQHDDLSTKLQSRTKDKFYSERHFNDSLTFKQWVPITCHDITLLEPFLEVYKRSPNFKNFDSKYEGPFFFRNHPIRYVTVCGWCTGFEKTLLGKDQILHYLFKLDDGTGKEISCFKPDPNDILHYENCLNKFIEIKGQLKMRKYGLTVNIRDIGIRESALEEFILLEESLQVRKEILSKSWYIQEVEQELQSIKANIIKSHDATTEIGRMRRDIELYKARLEYEKRYRNIETDITAEPELYCSLTRSPSIFKTLPNFTESITTEPVELRTLTSTTSMATKLPTITINNFNPTDTIIDEPTLQVIDSLS